MDMEKNLASALLARRVASAHLEDISPEAVEHAKTLILDIFGDAIAGSSIDLSTGLLAAATSWGAGDVPAWADGSKLTAPDAVLVNSHRAHCLEFDPFHEGAVVHPVTVVLPCALATVTRLHATGKTVTGKDLLRAVVVGVDTAVVVGMAATETLRFFRPATAGAFGGVAAIAALSEWDSERTLNAIGLVLGFASGTMQAHEEGSSAMALIVGMNGRAAMTAADLTLVDFHPPRQVFEGKFGFYNVIESGGDIAQFKQLIKDIGTGGGVLGTSIKPYPSGRATHGAIFALEQIAERRPVTATDVTSIRVEVPPLISSLVGRPVVDGIAVNYARLSLPYLASRFLLDGYIGIDSFDDERLSDKRTREQSAKVKICVKEIGDPNAFNPHEVTVTFKDGHSEYIKVEDVLGSPGCPMSQERVHQKFRYNAATGSNALDAAQTAALERLVENIEGLEDASVMVAAIAQGKSEAV